MSGRESFWLVNLHPEPLDVRGEVAAGLAATPKHLAPKLFYDAAGSRLFDRITRQPEYYLTRTETDILRRFGAEMVRLAPRGAVLVELGSGTSRKTCWLLDHWTAGDLYVPVDISADALRIAARRLKRRYPHLGIRALVADYTAPVAWENYAPSPRLVAFLGSTIGNFEPEAAVRFLARLGAAVRPGGAVLVGVDLKKDVDALLRAYNDAAGVTARFNLNLLARCNRELGADFDLGAFGHAVRWNAAAGRIEMHLVSLRAQDVRVAGRCVHFAAGETIHTENSYKFTPEEFERLAAAAGLATRHIWFDADRRFGVYALVPR
ncbi:MAG: L-histidine N(alpha)-methyltransferase [Actinomycetia bacterium]|nr:L-histidine N(alpha)-methyltransferase [Actinomycetes bacterium]